MGKFKAIFIFCKICDLIYLFYAFKNILQALNYIHMYNVDFTV